MTLPACLDPRIANPAWDTERRYVEVILHGTGCMRCTESMRLWFRGYPEPMHVPLRQRIWLDVITLKVIIGTANVCVTKLRECDELPE